MSESCKSAKTALNPANYVNLAEIRRVSSQIELERIELLTAEGFRAKSRGQVHTVRLTYIDGQQQLLDRKSFMTEEFNKMQFKLRPSVNHA